jgi:hypothetical protein
MALSGWTLYRTRNVFLVRYELGFYIPEDGILHSHRRENLKSYIDVSFFILGYETLIKFPIVHFFYFPDILVNCGP